MSSEYASIPSTGKLKLKGVKDSKVDKKKKKKKTKDAECNDPRDESFEDKSATLKQLEDEDRQIAKDNHRDTGVMDAKKAEPGAGVDGPELGERIKTEAERRHEEQRRKRLDERLKREGVKTHKQRVEELNRYLSSLSEHHDMPRIGPG